MINGQLKTIKNSKPETWKKRQKRKDAIDFYLFLNDIEITNQIQINTLYFILRTHFYKEHNNY